VKDGHDEAGSSREAERGELEGDEPDLTFADLTFADLTTELLRSPPSRAQATEHAEMRAFSG
jgi:hypothetical protein